MTSTKRFIRSQGDLDSACFLYSLVNAVQCLSGKKLLESAWQRLISCTYDPRDFLTSRTGTKRIDDHPHLIAELASRYIATLEPRGKYRVDLLEGLDSTFVEKNPLKKQTLLVVDNGTHWFCMLDSSGGQIFVSCSAVWQNNPAKYTELSSPRLRRTYNDSFPASKLVFFQQRALLVTAK